MRVAVIGAGSWGTAVAALAARNADVTLWARRPELASAIESTRENPDYLPGSTLPRRLRATTDLEEAVGRAEAVVIGVPSHGFRMVVREAAPHLPSGVPIVSLTKGIERETERRMTEVVLEEVDHPPLRVGVLTGPNLAHEIMAGQPAATVVAIRDEWEATRLQQLFMGPTFRVYTNPDVVGAEAAGALKNVMAIAAGMARGLGYGDNSIAALITRALAELTRLGVARGGEPLTFAGLAGMGDLVATCTSPLSRNRTVGVSLGEGKSLEEIVAEMRMVAEGVKTTEAVLSIADRLGVEMPIARMVGQVLYEGTKPEQMVEGLMGRAPKAELHGIAP
ncbi:MAG TPA: NAD(P)H-dependent glycerol-3-phosphate dehydrogenase [Acidimicrobiia bacterium]|nr:NAD(P)H-dependent glycerol-3-phosphate dehydrogenase [Acidimicrobiia bacterium]